VELEVKNISRKWKGRLKIKVVTVNGRNLVGKGEGWELIGSESGKGSEHGSGCFAPSPRRPSREYKRMVLELTHGLFIT
jgi:hypothetical protein